MPGQNIVVNNLGQYGFMPDVAVTSLPPNAATFTRNWRFNEGDYAEVSPGYTNALDTRNLNQLGNTTTNATFLYTWLLNNENSFFYYDAGNSQMRYVENNSSQNLVDNNLSVGGTIYLDTLTYATGTPTVGQFNIAPNRLRIFPAATGATSAILQLALTVGATIEFFQNDELVVDAVSFSGTDNTAGGVTTVTQGGFPQDIFEAGATVTIRISVPREHSITSNFAWTATDALGLPIFNNPDEAPYSFTDTTIPSIQPLANWPTGGTCSYLTRFNSFLIAVGYENMTGPVGERGGNRTVAISDVITTPGVAPNWDFANVDSFSQIFDLSLYTDGELVSAFESNNQLYVNSTTDVIVFTYAGDGEFNATKLPIGSGVITRNGSVPIPNGYFNIGNGRIYTHDGSSFTPVGDGIWTEQWFDILDDNRLDEVQCVYDPRSTSVWIKTPISDTAQEIWIYNLDTQSLSVLDDHQEIAYMVFSAEGVPARSTTWDNLQGDWDSLQQNAWNEFPVLDLGEFRNRILSVGGREVFVHDFGESFNGRIITAIFRKEFLQPNQDTYQSFTIDRLILWLDGSGTASARVGGTDTPRRGVTAYTPFRTWTLGTTQKQDYRYRTKWAAVEVTCDTPGVRLTGYELMIVGRDRR